MLEPYSKARLINTTLNNRTKPFKVLGIMYWFSRILINVLRWCYLFFFINNKTFRLIALLLYCVWPLVHLLTISSKQMTSCCRSQPNPCCKVIVILFLSIFEALLEFPTHFICYAQQVILQFSIFGYLFDENQVKIRDFIRFWTEFAGFLIITSINISSYGATMNPLYIILVVLMILMSCIMAYLVRLLHKSDEIKY